MKVNRLMFIGGAIGGVAAWTYLATEGLISAAGLVVAVFDLLVITGIGLAITTEGLSKRSFASIAARVRAVRNRQHADATCGVCSRVTFYNGAASFCPSCDHIPTVMVA